MSVIQLDFYKESKKPLNTIKLTINIEKLVSNLIQENEMLLDSYDGSSQRQVIGIEGNPIHTSLNECDAILMLEDDIYKIFKQAQMLPTFINLDEVRQRVIVELIFNLGFKNVHAFTRMWEALENDKFEDAADEMLNTRWAQQNRKRATRLSQWMRMGNDN